MIIEYFGAYNKEYPRNAVLRKGLMLNGAHVIEHHVSHKYQSSKAYPLLIKSFLAQREKKQKSVLLVPEFNHRIILLAWFLAKITNKFLVFDPFVSLYDSIILNRDFTAHTLFMEKKYRLHDYLGMKLPDMLLADTNEHKKFFSTKYSRSPENIHCVPVGADDEIFKPANSDNLQDAGCSVLFYGKCAQMHGVDVIYQAALAIGAHYPDIHFTFIGSGLPFDIVRNDASMKQLPHITFYDNVPLNELIKYINKADLILGIFGLTEKAKRVIPNKVVQGLAMKKPVLTMDSPAIHELFEPHVHLFTCEPGNPQALADAVIELYRNKNLQQQLAANGYLLFQEKLTPKPLGETLLSILERVSR